ncbi:Gfo/Idh/MocA family oxidoreductase [Longimicrobium sp.]|uniref:Gfo/Idh/MocA family protein n=1 Tax=Longimicrobium sp. TaxID=2029185 RepID=UPI002E31E753|nr:Gfo/Idh/MocA family oxidoreductase [Longimicrobium sp.]HEX6038020.1 Gfo/Idh/MocA family oxidoreductase [Longimicrobium sp.]
MASNFDGLSRRDFVLASAGGLLGAAMSATPSVAQASASAGTGAGVAQNGTPQEVRAIGRPMPELENPLPLPPDQRVGWAIVGLGDFALNQILPAIGDTRMCRLSAVVSGNADKAREVARAYGVAPSSVYSYEDFDRIRDNPDVQVVYVILPNALHRDWTLRAAGAGKHVLCEKPMAVSVEDCRAMIQACRAAGRKLMIAYRAQFEPHALLARQMITEGRIGDVQSIAGEHGRMLELDKPRDQWRARQELAGGGSLYDIGIYNINTARFLLGREPVEVTATLRRADDPRITVETGVDYAMRFEDGTRSSFNSSYEYKNTKRLQVMGTEGTIELDPATEYYGNRLLLKTEQAVEQREIRPTNQFASEMDHFAECVMHDRDPRTPGEEGMRDVAIMQAIYEAARTGRPVEVPRMA